MAERVARATSRAGAVRYAAYGSGSLPGLLFEALQAHSSIQLTQVPYRGITPAVTAAMSGEVELTLSGVAGAMAYISAGKLKALAVARPTRLKELPQVPTLKEAGLEDIDPRESWFGLFATAGTPAAVIQKIHQAVAEIGADAGFRQQYIVSRGFDPVFSTPEEFARFIQADMKIKGQMIQVSGATAE